MVRKVLSRRRLAVSLLAASIGFASSSFGADGDSRVFSSASSGAAVGFNDLRESGEPYGRIAGATGMGVDGPGYFGDTPMAGIACDGACDSLSGCDSGCGSSGCAPWWAHRTSGFGELLMLQPGSTDIAYTVEQDDIPADAFPTGPVGQVNIDDELGYRVGFALARSHCSSIVASYTDFESSSDHSITAQPGNFLLSQVIHPSTLTAGSTAQAATASQAIDFQLVDVAMRQVLAANDAFVMNWLAGFRYGRMEQNFRAAETVSVATGLVTVDTDIDFDGFGLQLGLDAMGRDCRTGLLAYSRGVASVLGGTWQTDYVQTPQLAGGIVANSSEDYRLTPVLELELGVGWQSKGGRVRATTGYLVNAWYNAVSTRSYIQNFRAGNYDDFEETVTFDGLTTRLEVGF